MRGFRASLTVLSNRLSVGAPEREMRFASIALEMESARNGC